VSQIGRELGITRQAASRIVPGLRDRRYLTLRASATDKREKFVTLTPRAVVYLASQREAARDIERALRNDLGEEGFKVLYRLLEALGGDEDVRLRDYLRKMETEECPSRAFRVKGGRSSFRRALSSNAGGTGPYATRRAPVPTSTRPAT
jgi:hypothetical protein